MPITQDRMIELINAAIDYRQALQRIIRTIIRETEQAHDNPEYVPTALSMIFHSAQPSQLLTHFERSSFVVERERDHFARQQTRNDQQRTRQERQRLKEERNKPRPTRSYEQRIGYNPFGELKPHSPTKAEMESLDHKLRELAPNLSMARAQQLGRECPACTFWVDDTIKTCHLQGVHEFTSTIWNACACGLPFPKQAAPPPLPQSVDPTPEEEDEIAKLLNPEE